MKFVINDVEFNKFSIKSKPLIERYLSLLGTELEVDISDYTFAANYIWLENASGFYAIIEDSFCLFCMAGSELSMLLPPLGKISNLKKAIVKCFEIMNENNTKQHYSRIDYVAGSILEKFAEQIEKGADIFDVFEDYIFEKRLVDYIYKSDDLIELRGNSYHTKRTEINKFKNTYPNFKIETLEPNLHREEIINLANVWASERIKYMPSQNVDDFLEGIYQEKAAIKRMLDHYAELELIGIVLFIDDTLKGFTVGERINEGVASVIIEKTDFATLGSAQFIFREFSKVLKSKYDCDFINVGDDMGFENLKKVKMSYRPNSLEVKYSIYQKL
ncbi:DUF2156 domain-containing protein [Campylobacter hyointestinalis]|uniref:DUF2156 domain-containing protein n=1 Tax=Campylobacter hyointestinalis TaxID=198 RepID=UPI002553C1C0|nr:phosphatidylglycerol lysyltransferase domain-containing protein [Campylobacter hyointestinalis]MDL2347715.1 phosphatidylglycerol lysyltransferase domain-containing protein [Campylobacter hyointestinalis]MDL2349457.1 phosphatidylglycerol lysyltransferase domain-containing protein [Campylobacter hyointestinalis]MDL2351205.1 phosphatidylglycerol lysyltransferase domain-containing protein [Campylobacter hyointestinalis]MDM1027036.1 phosphatidylglycerol lysyltransferase domain-containing protein 